MTFNNTVVKLFLTALVIVSLQIGACKKKAGSDPDPTPTPTPTEGLFLPTTVNSTWTYDTGVDQYTVTVTKNSKMLVGKKYSEFTTVYSSGPSKNSYYAYSNGKYTSIISDSAAGDQELIYLKENPTVGQRWKDTVLYLSIQFIYQHEVIETNASVSTGTLNFKDAVLVRTTGTGFISDDYYVKNVGLVRTIVNNSGNTSTYQLKSYSIK